MTGRVAGCCRDDGISLDTKAVLAGAFVFLFRVNRETAALASRFSTAEILRRIRLLEELRDHLGRNVHEGLAIEVAFLTIFTA